MADRVSTLRLKVVGMDDAATEVDSFSRKYGASMAKIDQINRTIGERLAGGLDTSKWDAALKGVQERASKIAERAGITDPMKGFEFKEQDVKEDLANNLKRFAGNQEAIESSERAFNAEMADIAAQRTAYLAKPEEEALKIREKSAADASKLQLKLNDDELKAKEQANEEAWASQAKWEKATFEDYTNNLSERLKATEKYNAELAKENERALDAELDRGAKYQRAEAEQLEEASKTVEKFESEMARNRMRDFQERVEAGQGGSGRGGLNGFGARMILGMAAGRAAGDIIGDRHGGQEIGSIVSGFMFAGPEIGLAIAGIEGVGMAFKAMHDDAEAAAKGVSEFIGELRDLSSEWAQVGTELAKGDSFEESMKKIVSESAGKSDKAQDAITELLNNGTTFGEKVLHPFNFDASNIPKINAQQDIIDAQDSNADAARAFQKDEGPKRVSDQERVFEAEQRVANLRVMQSGTLKDQAVLNAQIAADHEKMITRQGEENRQSDASLKMSKQAADDLQSRADKIGEDPDNLPEGMSAGDAQKLLMAKDDARQKYQDDLNAREQLDAKHATETKEQAEKSESDKADLAEKGRQYLENLAARADEAETSSIANTYDRQIALLQQKEKRELSSKSQTEKEKTEISRYWNAERAKIDSDIAQAVDRDVKAIQQEVQYAKSLIGKGTGMDRRAAKWQSDFDKEMLTPGINKNEAKAKADAERDKDDANTALRVDTELAGLAEDTAKDNALSAASSETERLNVEHSYEVRKAMHDLAIDQATAEKIAKAEDDKKAAGEHLSAKLEVERELSKAQYLTAKDNALSAASSETERLNVEHIYEVRKAMHDLAIDQATAEKIAKAEDDKKAAGEHLSAKLEVERELSKAQYLADQSHAKTKADTEKAKHDYEVREEMAKGHSAADAENLAKARDLMDARDPMDEVKQDRGMKNDANRYIGVVGGGQTGGRFYQFGTQKDVHFSESDKAYLSGLVEAEERGKAGSFHERFGYRNIPGAGAIPSGAGAIPSPNTKTPADIVQENILKVLQEIAAQKMS